MLHNHKATGRATSMPAGLLWGASVSLLVTLLGSAITALLLSKEILAESSVGYSAMIILMTAAYAGALTARGCIKRQHLMVCMLSGGIYFLSLLSVTALFFGGQFEAVGVTALLAMGGSVLALLTDKQPRRAGRGRKKKVRNR